MNNHIDVGHSLRLLGEERRRMGAEALRQIPHPCLYEAARTLVERAYTRGDFGDGDKSAEWGEAKARDLADVLEGAYYDWVIEAVK